MGCTLVNQSVVIGLETATMVSSPACPAYMRTVWNQFSHFSVLLSQLVKETELIMGFRQVGRHMIHRVKIIVNMAEFVHVHHFGRSYNQCVIPRANVDAVKALANNKDVTA